MAKPPNVVFSEYQSLIRSSRTTTAIVNAFDLNWAENTNVYHYDAMVPLWEARPGKPIVISRKKASEVIMRMQTHVLPELFPKHGVFDGKKNMFSWIKYDIAEISVQVALDSGERRNMKMVGVTVKYVKVVNVGILSRVARGDTSVSEQASEALNMLNMSVQAYPRSNQDVLSKGAAFYISHRKRADNKIAPFELWHGFNQTVRLTHKGLILNVNTTVGIIVPKRSLQDIAMTFLHLRNLRDLDRLQPHDPNFLRLKAVIRVLRVCPNYGRNRRGRKAGGLVPNASDITFDNKDGRTVTVSQHFQSAYGMALRPNELGISFDKSDTVIPISCLDTEQQLFNNQASPEILREILEFIPRNPQERLNAIENGWDQLGLSASEFLNGAKISVTARPKTVNGRLLARPALQFGQQFVIAAGHLGTWDVMRKQLHSPISIGRAWCVVDFSGSRDQNVIIKFSDDLKIAMAALGIDVQKPAIFHENPRRDLPKIMYANGGQVKALLMVVILPDNAPEIYNAVKQWGDVTSGVATQCVRWSRKLSDSISSTRGANQYLNNLILKINAKLFGRSFVPIDSSTDFFQGQPTMIIGADVSHPGPQSNFPSIASVVASVDRLGTKYTARIEIQKSRVEIIQDLEAMMVECFSTFFELNKTLPQRLIFYRDGVSEGEFETVLQAEVNTSLRNATDRFYRSKGASESQRPKLTFIVVTKRHHIRFIPNNPQNTDRSRNCQAGFVVEDDLRRPLYDDFYLQSQAGLKGTSVPGHYTILRDDIFESFFKNKLLAKQAIEQFTYTLCHSYSRATRSVKIPAPVYYADLVCRRGKFHFDDLSDTRSVQSGGSDMDLAEYRRHFKPLHNGMKTSMFFM